MQKLNTVIDTLVPSQSLVGRATSDNDQPTPGYMFVDLQNESNQSVEKCQQILSQLLNRLKKDSPVVKLKCLKCMKHLVLKGSAVFKQDLSTCSDHLQQCTNYRGQLDQFHGDAPYAAVREEANKLLNLLFQFTSTPTPHPSSSSLSFTQTPQTVVQVQPRTHQQQQSNGNTTSSTSSSSSSNNRVIVGFGSNGSMTNAPLPPQSKLDKVVEKIGAVTDKLHGNHNNSTRRPTLNDVDSRPSIPVRDGTHLMGSSPSSLSDHDDVHSAPQQDIIDEIIGNHTSTTLSSTSIARFIQYWNEVGQQQQQQQQLVILDQLDAKTQSKHWQIKQKTLQLIETLINDGQQQTCTMYFQQHSQSLINLSTSLHKSIREKSKQILKILGIEMPIVLPTTSSNNTSGDSSPIMVPSPPIDHKNNMFEFDEHPSSSSPGRGIGVGLGLGSHTPPPTSPGMFGGLSVVNVTKTTSHNHTLSPTTSSTTTTNTTSSRHRSYNNNNNNILDLDLDPLYIGNGTSSQRTINNNKHNIVNYDLLLGESFAIGDSIILPNNNTISPNPITICEDNNNKQSTNRHVIVGTVDDPFKNLTTYAENKLS
ncbi:hypothetical protein SAMD00019534_036570 [Acytostelium subglobosum LB1]|uniref:hypothetical protein n=1 Tax=Acytostelium subglobosum LB1 TaxID=1410327 RepID=UPI000645099A|nr:hypothetical protein SAMD00019534_036570 [Acytostelium subglobosum LB1]GAM20482.1 hypothetical protein SAMD00019534_036570 [Acytostelium subglobosum LB1]|eukprot:XP_012760003.1 hypothetical protein SAMD00019534_036570 [Acytostelium subglobosum LB1]